MNLRHIANSRVLPVALLAYACAKVTTNYPDVDGGTDNSIGGSAGNGAIGIGGSAGNGGNGTGGTVTSAALGGAPLTGGARALGGLSSLSGLTGGSPNTGGAKATGGSIPGTGGTPPTGGAPPIIVGDAGPFCPAGAAFCDDFESYTGGTATQWTAGTGTWSVTTDATELAGDQRVYTNSGTSNSVSSVAGGTYASATIEARMRVTSFSSNSASNSAGIFLRSNGTNDYDLSLGGDGKIYLRRSQTSSTEETCSSGASNGTGVAVTTATGSGWFKLKLQVSGTVATGITATGWVDPTGSSGYTQVLQCTQVTGTPYMYDSGTAGVFSKSNAPAEYDDVVITSP